MSLRRVLGIDGRLHTQYMHRFILGIDDPRIYVDHINHDGLDNRRSNLRACTASQNQGNRRPRANRYKGVNWHKANNRWYARIKLDGKLIHLGVFGTAEDAARAYDAAAIKMFGPFACTNLPSGPSSD